MFVKFGRAIPRRLSVLIGCLRVVGRATASDSATVPTHLLPATYRRLTRSTLDVAGDGRRVYKVGVKIPAVGFVVDGWCSGVRCDGRWNSHQRRRGRRHSGRLGRLLARQA
jgi:hypothetical protein